MKNIVVLIVFSMIINSIPKCSQYIDNQEQRNHSDLQNKVELHVTVPSKITLGDSIGMLLEIKNTSDQSVVLYKDAAILLTIKQDPTIFGESKQFLNGSEKWRGFREKINLSQGDIYTFQLKCSIEPPLFQSGVIDDLLLQYVVAKTDEIDLIEYSLDTIVVLEKKE